MKKQLKVRLEDLEVGDVLLDYDATVKRITVRNSVQAHSNYGVVVSLDLHGTNRKDSHTLIGAFDDEYEVDR